MLARRREPPVTGNREPSRIQTPQDPPLTLHWYVDAEGSPVAFREAVDTMAGIPERIRGQITVQIRARISALCAGALRVGDDFKPVVSQPDIFELVFSFTGLAEDPRVELRLYWAEPPTHPGYLVALAFHRKDLAGTDDEIREAQNQVMLEAQRRYDYGRSAKWGIR